MYECFHCGEKAVIWDGDFSFDDYGDIVEVDGNEHRNFHIEYLGGTKNGKQ